MSRGRESAASRRGNKTLAWFINDGILDNRESTSPNLRGTSMAEHRKDSVERRASLASEKTDRSTPQSEQGEKQQRRRNRRNDRRANKKQTNTVHPEAAGTDHHHAQHHSQQNAAAAGADDAVAKKEDYWYYDPVSDGFYYELNGSRGWRKRVPRIHGPPPMPAAAKRELQEQKPIQLPQAVLPNKLFPIAAAAAPPNVPSIKYYDAATDGYFYEMASVDGWRRRQPVAPSSAPDASGFAQHVHQQQGKVAGVQQIAADLNAAPRSLPNSFTARQHNPRRTMTNAEVEDMIVASTQRGAAESPFYSGIFSQQPITPTAAQPTTIGDGSPMLFSSVLSGSSVAAPQASQSLQKSRLNAYMTADEYPSSLSSASSSAFDERMIKTSSMSSLEEFASPMPQDIGSQPEQQTPQQFNGLQAHNRPKSLSISGRPSKLLPLYSRIDSYLPGFNVDAFIADLPPAVDHEKILNNLTAMRTPLGDANAEQFGESPLFTPTHMRADLWDRAASESSTAATATKCRGHDSYDSAAVTLEQSLRDIEKLWHSAL